MVACVNTPTPPSLDLINHSDTPQLVELVPVINGFEINQPGRPQDWAVGGQCHHLHPSASPRMGGWMLMGENVIGCKQGLTSTKRAWKFPFRGALNNAYRYSERPPAQNLLYVHRWVKIWMCLPCVWYRQNTIVVLHCGATVTASYTGFLRRWSSERY